MCWKALSQPCVFVVVPFGAFSEDRLRRRYHSYRRVDSACQSVSWQGFHFPARLRSGRPLLSGYHLGGPWPVSCTGCRRALDLLSPAAGSSPDITCNMVLLFFLLSSWLFSLPGCLPGMASCLPLVCKLLPWWRTIICLIAWPFLVRYNVASHSPEPLMELEEIQMLGSLN